MAVPTAKDDAFPRPAPQPVIPIYRPDLSGNERRYVLDCLDTGWISSLGVYVERFERAVAGRTGAAHAVATCNGTVALHLALHGLGIGPGDEVIVPSFTYVASVNAISYTGARPVLADSRASDWLLDPAHAEALVTPRTCAIMAVHLYGAACDMAALRTIADRHGLALVEDAAEALGTTIGGRHAGSFGDAAAFSFFGNKTVTTGEGGMAVCGDPALAARMLQARGQGQSFTRRYWHEVMGFNYRMTNVAAAIGCAQMERLDAILARKRALAARYRALLAGLPVAFQQAMPGVDSAEWLVSVLLPEKADREAVMTRIAARGVETRPVFHCAHTMPVHRQEVRLPVAEAIAARGISLPSFPGLTDAEQDRVAEALADALGASL
jgi:perosamine synthetase